MPIDQPDLIVERYLRRLGGGRPDPAALTFFASLDQMRSVDPLVADRVVAELVDQRSQPQADRQRELRLAGRPAGDGQPAHRQVRRGLPAAPLLRRLRQRRRHRGARRASLARELFGAEHAYVQPHSGADANLVAFLADPRGARRGRRRWSELGGKNPPSVVRRAVGRAARRLHDQRLLGLDYYSGGHLTHGYRLNISAQLFDVHCYSVDRETKLLDLDALRDAAREVRPLILLAGYSAYPRKINFAEMREIADEVGAVFMVDMAHFAGLVAGKVFTGDYDPVAARARRHHAPRTRRCAARAAASCSARTSSPTYVDKGCPAGPRRPAAARDGRQGGRASARPSRPSSATTPQRIVDNAQALADGLPRPGHGGASPAAPTTTCCWSTSRGASG